MYLQIFHLNGTVKYCGWIKGNVRWLKSHQRIYDIEGIMLFLFEGMKVTHFNEKGIKIDQGVVKNGVIHKSIVSNTIVSEEPITDDLETISSLSFSDENSLDSSYTSSSSSSTVDLFTYDGEIFNEIPDGRGILKKNGDIVYVGHFVDGQRSGKGVSFIGGKKIYNGSYKNGDFHGYGRLFHYLDETLVFEGNFKNGFPFYGKIYSDHCLLHEGLFKNYNGNFCFPYEEGIYIGLIENGRSNNYGCLFNDKAQTIYKGHWKNNLYHGKGSLFDSYGTLEYSGEWKNGMKDGYGIFYDIEYGDSYKYVGDFKEDKKEGYGILYENENFNDKSSWVKKYSGWWKNDEKHGDALCYNSDKLFYEGEMKDGYENGFGNRFYEDGTLQYKGYFKRNHYHGQGTLFYIEGTVCFEGIFKNGNPCNGTFYNFEDGSVHPTEIINGDYYTKGVLIEPETNGTIYHRGSFKNGLFHGDAISKDYTGSFKDGKFHGRGTYHAIWKYKDYTGQFINGLFCDGKKLIHLDTNQIVYEGTIKNEKYDTGIETIFQEDDEDYVYPIGYRKWKDGEIVNEKDERKNLRQKMLLASFLETKNKKILEKLYKQDYLNYLQTHSNYSNLEKMTKKQLIGLILQLEKPNQNPPLDPSDPLEQFDLFGNQITNPVVGLDGETYDESSMKYLFQCNEKREFVNISYTYNEDGDRVPNYPITSSGKILNGYINKDGEVINIYLE